jgi:hypothetical protein
VTLPRKKICWNELTSTLSKESLLSSYDLRYKNKSVMVNFFRHPVSPGLNEKESISILIMRLGKLVEWEIFLNKDGTWDLI